MAQTQWEFSKQRDKLFIVARAGKRLESGRESLRSQGVEHRKPRNLHLGTRSPGERGSWEYSYVSGFPLGQRQRLVCFLAGTLISSKLRDKKEAPCTACPCGFRREKALPRLPVAPHGSACLTAASAPQPGTLSKPSLEPRPSLQY